MTVDIMLPYYGDPRLLRLAVRSILEQDDPDWRLTVVDDAYPDESVAQWFSTLADRRIRYRRNKENIGANRNYRQCLRLIDHDITVIMGADDVMLPNYVRVVRELHRRFPQASIATPGVQVIDEAGNPYRTLVDECKQRLFTPRVREPKVLRGERLAVSLMRANWLYFPALAFKSDALRKTGFRSELNVTQDVALVMDMVRDGRVLALTPELCFQYRRHRDSDSTIRALAGDRFDEQRRYFRWLADCLQRQGWNSAARVARRHTVSRLHALTVLPGALREHGSSKARIVGRHVFGLA